MMDYPLNVSSFPEDLLPALNERLASCRRVWVAYSGGMDSHVLLHLLSQHSRSVLPDRLHAVHVNHGIHALSDEWEAHCRAVCQSLHIPLSVQRVEASLPAGTGIEAWAREHRYQALASLLLEENDAVLTAHHSEDQAETVLLQMLRGAGADGLAAMPGMRPLGKGQLLRPLLSIEKQQLLHYARQHKLRWVEDDSNRDPQLARSYLRHKVMPLLREHWPGVNRCLTRTARHQSDLRLLLQETTEADLTICRMADSSLCITAWKRLSDHRADGVMRTWLKQQGWPALPEHLLSEIRLRVIDARSDRNPCLYWHGYSLRRYKQRLFSVHPVQAISSIPDWNMDQPLSLPLGVLQARRVVGSGILEKASAEHRLCLRFRQGGERLAGGGTLKRYLSEQSVFPWLRDHLPLIYSGDQLIQIPGLWTAKDWIVSGADTGWQIDWQELPYIRPAGQQDNHPRGSVGNSR